MPQVERDTNEPPKKKVNDLYWTVNFTKKYCSSATYFISYPI